MNDQPTAALNFVPVDASKHQLSHEPKGQIMTDKQNRKPRRRASVPDRYMAFVDGDLSVEDLDDEEIMRGQIRNASGGFGGRPPKAIPREFYVAVVAEQHRRFQQQIAPKVEEALATLMQVMNRKNPVPGDAARVKAATYVIDRFAGRIPETVRVQADVTTRFEQNIDAALVYDLDDDAVTELEDDRPDYTDEDAAADTAMEEREAARTRRKRLTGNPAPRTEAERSAERPTSVRDGARVSTARRKR